MLVVVVVGVFSGTLSPLLCCTVTWESLNAVRKRFLSSSFGAWSISSGVKRVLSGGGGGVRFDCDTEGEGLRSLSIRLLFLLFCCTSSSWRLLVVRPNSAMKSNFCARKLKRNKKKEGLMSCHVHLCLAPSQAGWRAHLLAGVVPLWSHPI